MMLPFKVVVLLLLLQSCKDPYKGGGGGGPVIPNCAWDKTEQIVFYNLQLKYPAGLSDYNTRQLPNGGIDRSFIDVLLRNGDAGSFGQTANIRANVKSNGTKCIGEKTTTYDRSNYTSGLGGALIKTPFPSNAPFVGEITVTMKSNVYLNTSGSGSFYHILWEQTGNNPNGGMANTMIGKKISYYNTNGRSIYVPENEIDYYYSGGRRVSM